MKHFHDGSSYQIADMVDAYADIPKCGDDLRRAYFTTCLIDKLRSEVARLLEYLQLHIAQILNSPATQQESL
jgi:hypothetical protein